jgi:predicted RNA binding protein YcfA (HicA-like mRNA interferase family)
MRDMTLHIELDREQDGRWLAEILDVPGVMGGRVLAALLKIGWRKKRQRGSHLILERDDVLAKRSGLNGRSAWISRPTVIRRLSSSA